MDMGGAQWLRINSSLDKKFRDRGFRCILHAAAEFVSFLLGPEDYKLVETGKELVKP